MMYLRASPLHSLRVQWEELPVVHGFFGCPHQDEERNVYRSNALKTLDLTHCYVPRQAHTSRVFVLPKNENQLDQVEADALVTCTPGIALGIFTADCAPVLFYDTSGIIGIAHAGWRGAVGGVLEETVSAIKEHGASFKTLTAVIGPTIRQQSYEVKTSFKEHVVQVSRFDASPFFLMHQERLFFDLPGYIAKRLSFCVGHIHDVGYDTFGSLFFSHRYALSQGKERQGSSLSVITLSPRI